MEKSALDILWIIVASTLVFIMQAGFAMVESGMTRSKNSINVAIKNLTDLGISTVFFWAFGFALMFGASVYGIFGNTYAFFKSSGIYVTTFFLFQTMFCSTSATIVSGAVAERMRYSSYILSTILMSALIYPVFGHWAWGGALEGAASGWLGKMGFIDFAGSTVVHSMGGWVSLALLLIIGSRKGRFSSDGKANQINGSNIPMTVLGVMILWFGWFGFNGGSTLAFNSQVASIILHTTLAGSAGMIGALAIGWPIYKKPDVNLVLNGSLAGLVAITASCHAVNELDSVIIGAIGGAVMVGASFLLEKVRIDDAVGAIPVHLAAGIWGTLAVGIFGNLDTLGTHLSRTQQIIAQLTGIGACALWGFGISFAVIFVVNKLFPVRVSEQDEQDGLNVAEHGVSTEILDLYNVLEEQSRTGDISKRAPVEPFTEVGQIAGMYNNVLQKLESSTVEKTEYLHILDNVSDGLFLISSDKQIAPFYSAALEEIFHTKKISGMSFVSLLSQKTDEKTIENSSEFLDLLFDGRKNIRTVEKLNPLRDAEISIDMGNGNFSTKFLQFHFKRIGNDATVERVMVLVRDVTKQRELSEEVEKTRQRTSVEMELFYRILHVESDVFTDFVKSVRHDISSINELLSSTGENHKARMSEIFRRTHSIKGDADMLGLDFLAQKAHEMEDSIQSAINKKEITAEDFLPVTIFFSDIKGTFEKINELFEKWVNVKGSAKNDFNAERYLSASLEKLTGRLSERHGKKASIECFSVDEARVPDTFKKSLKEILVQLVRNSMYHGIENAENRAVANKPAEGLITIKAENTGTHLRIVYRDDGAGLDARKILAKAVESGIVDERKSSELAEKDIYPLIFRDSLSTAETANESAGRGMGMSLIKQAVTRHGGKITLRSKKGKFLEFEIIIPTEIAR